MSECNKPIVTFTGPVEKCGNLYYEFVIVDGLERYNAVFDDHLLKPLRVMLERYRYKNLRFNFNPTKHYVTIEGPIKNNGERNYELVVVIGDRRYKALFDDDSIDLMREIIVYHCFNYLKFDI